MSRLCRLRNASHGDDGQWAYSEIVGLREQLAALAEQNAKLRDALTICVCAMQDYQAGIRITEMFDRGERIGRNVLLTSEFPDLTSPVLNETKVNK